jgi:hypothetical protein
MLQRSGSLLLDTEHTEVRIRLNGNVTSFIQALSRKADAISFLSLEDGRMNITVHYPDDASHKLPNDHFPEGTILNGIVKKCRVVGRGEGEFALIPICYPSVPLEANVCASDSLYFTLFGDDGCLRITGDYKQDNILFYRYGLIAALSVLRWVLKDLSIGYAGQYEIVLPFADIKSSTSQGYDLAHLKVMYPSLSLQRLCSVIAEIEAKARKEGNEQRRVKSVSRAQRSIETTDLQKYAISLLQGIRHVLDERIMEDVHIGNQSIPHPMGLSAKEIFDLGSKIGLHDSCITSSLFDILIDEAYLVTHAESMICNDGIKRWCRTFEPDGEMISDYVRKYTAQWGLPYGL